MKKAFITILTGLAIFGSFKMMYEVDNYYYKTDCEVVSYCVVEDRQGNRYHCDTTGYKVGDTVKVKMCTNDTEENRYDDYAVGIK